MDLNRTKLMTHRCDRDSIAGGKPWAAWLPLFISLWLTVWLGRAWQPWVLMWLLACEIYASCKLFTWWKCRDLEVATWRHVGYLVAWPGLDAKAFLDPGIQVPKPTWTGWFMAALNTGFGACLFWGVARLVPAADSLLEGWIGMLGLIFLLHFGTFHLLALGWQSVGVNAQPLMKMPILSRSLAEFWGVRWNAAFNRIAHDLLFKRLCRQVGTAGATMGVFLGSGLIHDLVISTPAQAGYGLPTGYFLLQGAGLLFERGRVGRAWGLRRGLAGWFFTVLITAGPAFWLFHPAFVMRVIVPLMKAVQAL